MPAILLVKVADGGGQSLWKAGDVVNVHPTDHQFGAQEMPDHGIFYHITVTNRTVEQLLPYLQEWSHEPITTVDSNINGAYRITITSALVSNTGKNAITRAKMDNFIENWGGTYVSHTNTSYTFDITAFDALTSKGFFGNGVTQMVFVDQGFAGGAQRVRVSDRGPFTREQIEKRILGMGGTLVSARAFTMPAVVVYNDFKQDIEDRWNDVIHERARWRINAAGMALLAGNGGVASGTFAQVGGYVEDKLAD